MPAPGWKQLLAGAMWFRGPGRYPIAAYSEFMPPPRLGRSPYGGSNDPLLFADKEPWGWHVTEYEEALELTPGLRRVATQLLGALEHLGRGEPAHGISRKKLLDNPYWPPALAERAGRLGHERYIVLLPLALSRTQDDKGRVRWTLFGGSEQGPARAFWKSFFIAPTRETPEELALLFFRRLLAAAYGEPIDKLANLHRAGLRILPDDEPALPYWREEPLPSWTGPLLWTKHTPARSVKYLLTFRPFARLPAAVQEAYLASELHLLPFPGSLLFWGPPPYFHLQQELPFALQIPLLHSVARSTGWDGLRVPQSGWLHEPRPGAPTDAELVPVRNTYKRTHRQARIYRHEDELAALSREDPLAHVLFSNMPDDMGLYGKPMARNAQLWTHEYRLLLDGPAAAPADIERAAGAVAEGGLFGYRMQWPAMRVGRHEVYWHRPLVAYLDHRTRQPVVLPDAPVGYLTAYRTDQPDLARPVELWPRLLGREPHRAAVELFEQAGDAHPHQTTFNVRQLLDTRELLGRPLPRSLARRLLTISREQTLESWLDSLPARSDDRARAVRLAEELRGCIETESGAAAIPPARPKGKGKKVQPSDPLTFEHTAQRSFEVAYWKTIAHLAGGDYLNKNNGDCVHDPVTWMMLHDHRRQLDALGDYLLAYYTRTVAAHRMTGKALVGDLPFSWRTDFDFSWMDGWLRNQGGEPRERDLLVVIPGRDRRRAVIMADHYDTAYMADHYEKESGGNGARLAAAGADDNCSATAALMLAAPVFLELSRRGRLGCDVWLVHLTGEEFPADCLGARHLCQWLVEGTLKMRLAGGGRRDLSRVRVQGVFVLDMVAHNNDRERDVFQIAPGKGRESMELAYQAHVANELWNAGAAVWNQRPGRRDRGRGRRSPDGVTMPDVALHPQLRGEVRPHYAPRSTLYNTDGQIFSDAGVPVVLFMENYDINRDGYHDSRDTMDNIDLDYGAALAAIAIETVARSTIEGPPMPR